MRVGKLIHLSKQDRILLAFIDRSLHYLYTQPIADRNLIKKQNVWDESQTKIVQR